MALEHRVYDEKRNFIRMKINTPVRIRTEGADFIARCKDLSGAGMLIQTDQALALNTSVEITIEQDGDKHQPFRASGEVVRVDPLNPTGFILGLALTAIHE